MQAEVPDTADAAAWLAPRLPFLRSLHVRAARTNDDAAAPERIYSGPLCQLLAADSPPAAPALAHLVLFTDWDKASGTLGYSRGWAFRASRAALGNALMRLLIAGHSMRGRVQLRRRTVNSCADTLFSPGCTDDRVGVGQGTVL